MAKEIEIKNDNGALAVKVSTAAVEIIRKHKAKQPFIFAYNIYTDNIIISSRVSEDVLTAQEKYQYIIINKLSDYDIRTSANLDIIFNKDVPNNSLTDIKTAISEVIFDIQTNIFVRSFGDEFKYDELVPKLNKLIFNDFREESITFWDVNPIQRWPAEAFELFKDEFLETKV